MGYDTSKIYKLVCDDGHYYYGSTIQTLEKRLRGHKESLDTMTSKVYTHIREVGWKTVRIELVQAVVCETRKELRCVENNYILKSKDDPLCLNTLRSYTSDEEKRAMEKDRQGRNKEHRKEVVHKYYEANRDTIQKRNKEYYEANKQLHATTCREYNEKHKDDIQAQRKQHYAENKERLCKEKRESRARDTELTKQKMREYREKNRERINQLKREAYAKKKDANT